MDGTVGGDPRGTHVPYEDHPASDLTSFSAAVRYGYCTDRWQFRRHSLHCTPAPPADRTVLWDQLRFADLPEPPMESASAIMLTSFPLASTPCDAQRVNTRDLFSLCADVRQARSVAVLPMAVPGAHRVEHDFRNGATGALAHQSTGAGILFVHSWRALSCIVLVDTADDGDVEVNHHSTGVPFIRIFVSTGMATFPFSSGAGRCL
jgi:hypothetical protein